MLRTRGGAVCDAPAASATDIARTSALIMVRLFIFDPSGRRRQFKCPDIRLQREHVFGAERCPVGAPAHDTLCQPGVARQQEIDAEAADQAFAQPRGFNGRLGWNSQPAKEWLRASWLTRTERLPTPSAPSK